MRKHCSKYFTAGSYDKICLACLLLSGPSSLSNSNSTECSTIGGALAPLSIIEGTLGTPSPIGETLESLSIIGDTTFNHTGNTSCHQGPIKLPKVASFQEFDKPIINHRGTLAPLSTIEGILSTCSWQWGSHKNKGSILWYHTMTSSKNVCATLAQGQNRASKDELPGHQEWFQIH